MYMVTTIQWYRQPHHVLRSNCVADWFESWLLDRSRKRRRGLMLTHRVPSGPNNEYQFRLGLRLRPRTLSHSSRGAVDWALSTAVGKPQHDKNNMFVLYRFVAYYSNLFDGAANLNSKTRLKRRFGQTDNGHRLGLAGKWYSHFDTFSSSHHQINIINSTQNLA